MGKDDAGRRALGRISRARVWCASVLDLLKPGSSQSLQVLMDDSEAGICEFQYVMEMRRVFGLVVHKNLLVHI